MPEDFKDLKNNELLEPIHINKIYRELRRWRRAHAVPPMVIDGLQSSDSPPIFRMGGTGFKFLAVANGNIPARSGSSGGIGSVFLVSKEATYNGESLTSITFTTTAHTFDVYNASATTMTSGQSIDSGQYCWVEMDDEGFLRVTPDECS